MKPILAVVGLGLLVSTQVASAAERISAVAVARDGKSAVVASADRSVRVVSLPDKRELRRLSFTEIPAAVALSPSGALVAVGGFGFLDLVELATGKQLAHLADPIGHLSINALAFSPDGKTLAAAGDAGRVKLYDGATAKELRAISGLSKIVNAVAFAPDGKTLAVAGVDNAVSLFAVSGEPGAVLRAHKTWIAAMIFSIDGKQLVSADQNANVIVWDRASGKPVEELRGDNGWTYALAASPDGKLLAWGADGGVQLWDRAGKRAGAKLPTARSQITTVAFTPDGKHVIAGDYAGALHVVDVK